VNWFNYTGALRKHGSSLIWLDEERVWLAQNGRNAIFSDTKIQFCLTTNVVFKLTFRQSTWTVASLLKVTDLDREHPIWRILLWKTGAIHSISGLPQLDFKVYSECNAATDPDRGK
jgi:hypothetical protein